MDVYKELRRDVGCIVILSLAMQWAWPMIPFGKDATDPEFGRSGMALKTDSETGLQYLEGRGGVLTPRLNKNGEHMVAR